MRGVIWAAVIRDISTKGIGLLMAKRLESGVRVTIELNDASGSRLFEAEVIHAVEQEGRWLVGFTFQTELSDDDVRQLLQHG